MDGIMFRTSDPDRWGTGKGSSLTALEIDENNWNFLQRVQALENGVPPAIQIIGFNIIGSQMQVAMSDGTFFGPYTLPVAQISSRGEWQPNTDYGPLTLVNVPQQGLFFITIPHTSAATFDPTATDPDTGGLLYDLVFGEETYLYDFGFSYPGKPGQGIAVNEAIAEHMFIRPVYLKAGLPGSRAKLRTAPAMDLSLPLRKGNTLIGSIDFDAGFANGTFTFAADQQFNDGDVFDLVRPTDIDASARGLVVTFNAARGTL